MGNTSSNDAASGRAAPAVVQAVLVPAPSPPSDELFTTVAPAAPRPHQPLAARVDPGPMGAAQGPASPAVQSAAAASRIRPGPLVDTSRPPPPAGGFLRPRFNPFEAEGVEHFPDLDETLRYDPSAPEPSGDSIDTMARRSVGAEAGAAVSGTANGVALRV
jgi:hypothetical protein